MLCRYRKKVCGFYLTQNTKNARYPQDISNEGRNENNGSYSVSVFLLERIHEGHVVLGANGFDKEEGT